VERTLADAGGAARGRASSGPRGTLVPAGGRGGGGRTVARARRPAGRPPTRVSWGWPRWRAPVSVAVNISDMDQDWVALLASMRVAASLRVRRETGGAEA